MISTRSFLSSRHRKETTLPSEQKAGGRSKYRFLKRKARRDHNCEHCDKVFKFPSKLKEHLRVHTGERPFICCRCSDAFTQKHALLAHERRHDSDRRFACATCGKNCSSASHLGKHEQTAHMQLLDFGDELLLDTLLDTDADEVVEFGVEENRFLAGYTTASRLSNCHELEQDTSTQTYYASSDDDQFGKAHVVDAEEQFLVVPEQDECTGDAAESQAPSTSSRLDFIIDAVAKNMDVKPLTTSNARRQPTTFTCDVCGLFCKHPSKIKEHMRTHSGERPHGCPDCGKRFAQKSSLVNHVRRHRNEKPFACDQPSCNRRFVSRALLNEHHMAKHEMRKRYVCMRGCGARFMSLRAQRAHMQKPPTCCVTTLQGADGIEFEGDSVEQSHFHLEPSEHHNATGDDDGLSPFLTEQHDHQLLEVVEADYFELNDEDTEGYLMGLDDDDMNDGGRTAPHSAHILTH